MRRVTWWAVAGLLVLLALGAAGGYALAGVSQSSPRAIDTPAPVPAASPSYPAGLPDVLPDPTTPVLEPALPSSPERLGKRGFGVEVAVPNGWSTDARSLTEWAFTRPGMPLNTYLMRVRLLADLHLSVPAALQARITALRGAVDDFDLESQTENTFVATYIVDDHRRLTMERYLPRPGTGGDDAFVTVAVIGRLADREGLADLLARASGSLVAR